MLNSKPAIMELNNISDADKALVGQALRAAADGPFFPDWEFHILFGFTCSEFRAVAHAWPNVELNCADVALAVNNALNNLLGYPHRQQSVWAQWVSVGPSELDQLFCRLRKSSTESYFDRLK
jgi:hypothetical protein